MSSLFDFAVITIFAREFLEGSIIVGEYRTIVQRGGARVLEDGVTEADALRAIAMSAWIAIAVALLMIAAIAIPLWALSRNFDDKTSKIIEGVSKMVAGVCLLQLSLKIPKFLGVYGSTKKRNKTPELEEPYKHVHTGVSSLSRTASDACETDAETKTQTGDSGVHSQNTSSTITEATPSPVQISLPENVSSQSHMSDDIENSTSKLSLRSIRFNVAWNIWREVAECGVFLIPFFLSGDELEKIPLSAAVGSVVGCLMGWAIYVCSRRFTDNRALAAFVATLLLVLSAGLFTGGMHNLEKEIRSTRTVWELNGDFWSVDRLPMTVLKPFGYNDSRTALEMVTYWSWLLGVILHMRKYHRANKINGTPGPSSADEEQGVPHRSYSS